MEKKVKVFALGTIAFAMIACTSQKNQASKDQRPTGRQGGPPNISQLLTEMDANKDGKLSKSEVKGPMLNDFSKIDSNNDGFLTESELEKAPKPQRGKRPPKNN